ncbi:MAG: FtsW/RodA/SpoVE family cell cycle protein [Bacillota bacterium]
MVEDQNTRILGYIDDVCSQIKFREVHREIKLELKAHIQDIVDEYLSEGLSEKEAVSKAINQMGSSDDVGKQLNRIHKPRPEWSILSLCLLFMGLGLLAMYFIERQALFTAFPLHIFSKSLAFIIIGAGIAAGLYLFDYRKLEPYSRQMYLCTIAAMFLVVIFGQNYNGRLHLGVGPIYIDIVEISPLLLSIALAGILNKWAWGRPKNLLQGLLLCVAPLVLILASHSFSTGIIYSVTCITIMMVSGAGRKYSLLLTGLIAAVIMLPIISAPYRLQRLVTFIDPEKDLSGSGWLYMQLSKLTGGSGLWGQGLTLKPEFIPGLHTDFVFSYITFTFGWIAGGVLAALAVIFIIRLARIATTVKSSYARLLVSGFAAILAVQFTWNILMNLGFAPITGVGLPFISYGGSQLIFNAAAVGVISSVYRRRNISKTLINS